MRTVFFILIFCLMSFSTLAVTAERQELANNAVSVSSEKIVENVKKEPKKRFTMSPEMQAALANKNKQVTDGLTTSERFMKYLKSGVVHIIPRGLDHILFVLGLFLSTIVFSKLIWQVTTFTLAHTITLGLASVGWISVSASVVEPLIALSIAYIAYENVKQEEPGRSRLPVIFVFGLLHGLGFAYVLGDFGLSDDALMTSLLSFNIGVELGQLTVLLLAFLAFYHLSKKPSYRIFVQLPASVVIGGFGLFWLIERII